MDYKMIDLKELEELDRKRKMLRAIVLKDPRFGFDKGLTYMTKVFENTVSAQVYGIRYQNYLIEMLKAKIINQKEKISIAKKECEVLQYLIKNYNKQVSIDELSLNVWSYEDSPSAATIRTYIKNLRRILGDEYIINLRGVGYRFNKQ